MTTTDATAVGPEAGLGPTAAAARGRPSWSGLLRLSLVAVPVKAYPAASTAASVTFNQLHVNCGQRIQYQKRCPRHGPVEAADIVRGYQYAPGQYVLVEADELDRIRPPKDKALVLSHFLGAHQVDPVLFAGRSLYLMPDGPAAQHPYGVVCAALQNGNSWALGRVVLSGSRQLVVVRPQGRVLAMDVLRYPAEVRAATALAAELNGATIGAEELRLARMLMDAAAGPLDWSQLRDTSAEELHALIEAKIAGRPVTIPAEEPVAVLQLIDALKQSIEAAQQNSKPRPRRKAAAPRRSAASPWRMSRPSTTTTPKTRSPTPSSAGKKSTRTSCSQDPIGQRILGLRRDREELLDVIWLANSPKQIKALWSKVAELLGDEQTRLQKDALEIEPVDE